MRQNSTISMIYCRKRTHCRHTHVSTFIHIALHVQSLTFSAPNLKHAVAINTQSFCYWGLVGIAQMYHGTWQHCLEILSLQPATSLCSESLTDYRHKANEAYKYWVVIQITGKSACRKLKTDLF